MSQLELLSKRGAAESAWSALEQGYRGVVIRDYMINRKLYYANATAGGHSIGVVPVCASDELGARAKLNDRGIGADEIQPAPEREPGVTMFVRRGNGATLFLCIFTLGIYALYLFYQWEKELSLFEGKDKHLGWVWVIATIVTLGIAGALWAYLITRRLRLICEQYLIESKLQEVVVAIVLLACTMTGFFSVGSLLVFTHIVSCNCVMYLQSQVNSVSETMETLVENTEMLKAPVSVLPVVDELFE